MHATSTSGGWRSAASVETPRTGTASAKPSARAVARPIRRPVNVPGPVPATISSTASSGTPARGSNPYTSSSRRWAPTERPAVADSANTSPCALMQAVATSVAVSNERITNRVEQLRIVASKLDQPSIALSDPHRHGQPRFGQHAGAGHGPLDKTDGVLEVRLQVGRLLDRHARRPVEVEMGDPAPAGGVEVADRVGRARDGPLDPERTAGAAARRRSCPRPARRRRGRRRPAAAAAPPPPPPARSRRS